MPVPRAIHMLIQRLPRREQCVTEVALPVFSVPTLGRGFNRGVRGSAVRDHLLGDEVAWVALPDFTEDGVVGNVGGIGTGAGLEMMGDAGCSGESALAEGTHDVASTVGFAVEMLCG